MLIVFDVIGTLFSLDRLRERLEAEDLPPELLDYWLARLLHASFASTLADRYRPYRELLEPTLRQALAVRGLPDEGVGTVLDAFGTLDPWDDVAGCLHALREDGHRVVALTNGGRDGTVELMERSGIRDRFEAIHSADEVRSAKPSATPYRHVLESAGRRPEEAWMVAVHGWDVVGASAVGMRTAWISRVERRFPFPGGAPDLTLQDLSELPGRVG